MCAIVWVVVVLFNETLMICQAKSSMFYEDRTTDVTLIISISVCCYLEIHSGITSHLKISIPRGEMFHQTSNSKSQNCHIKFTIGVEMLGKLIYTWKRSWRSSQLCLLSILEWSLYLEPILCSHYFDVNHSIPLYIQASGLQEVWMEGKLHRLYMI